jgi:hypothetical protein
MKKVLKELVSLVLKEELNKSALEKQPGVVVPVQLYLEPEPVDQLGTEAVAVMDNKVYRLSKSYNAGNDLVDNLIMNFSKEVNESRPFLNSREDMRAYIQGKAMELEGLRDMRDGISLELLKQEAKNIASDIAAELEQNLYNVPDFLSKVDSIESLIDNLKKTYDLK